MSMRRKLVAGNWKMNGLARSADELDAVVRGLAERAGPPAARAGAAPDLGLDVSVHPPATLLFGFAERALETPLWVGAQDCHPERSGAHTGDLSAEMLADAGARLAILGHSERRAAYGETDALVRRKAEAALAAGMIAIVCVGETEAERDAGRAAEVVARQLAGSTPETARAETVAIAYEPVWAIGTGRTPSLAEIAEVHGVMRRALVERFGETGRGMRLLYGGSVKPANARTIFGVAEVDGALVGGASLLATDFLAIVDAARG